MTGTRRTTKRRLLDVLGDNADSEEGANDSLNSSDPDTEEERYEVETILREKDGRFFVKWAGYASSDNTWEPEANLSAVTVREFRDRRNKRPPPQQAMTATSTSEHQDSPPSRVPPSRAPINTSSKSRERPQKTRKKPDAADPKPSQEDPDAELLSKLVSFAPSREDWLPATLNGAVGNAFLTGTITRLQQRTGSKRNNVPGRLEVRWITTQFQGKNHVHYIDRETAERGIQQYEGMSGTQIRPESWNVLCRAYNETEGATTGDLLDDYEEVEEAFARFETTVPPPTNAAEVEMINAMNFHPNAQLDAPHDLFTHDDGTTKPRVKPEYAPIFEHSALSSFFAYLPLSFWRKVLSNTNEAAGPRRRPVTLDELMKFFGVLFYMALVDKGEYSNYWGDQIEESLFLDGDVSCPASSMDRIMTKTRFQFIRKHISFRDSVTHADLKQDPAARIRPLINMLKVRSAKFVDVGRNIAVDESSIACRSKFARHLIVFNPTKPTGKYHFRIYMACCSESWLMINFRLHCTSGLQQRLEGVTSVEDARALEAATEMSSEIRKNVLEVTRPIHHTKRIVNTDNFYSSCQLLEALQVFGLYGRGTIRENSKHYPRCVKIAKADGAPRGSMKQAVCVDRGIVAASWVDGTIVNIISNADPSAASTVGRRVGQTKVAFAAPTCIVEYNKGMQGVDRIDQLRSRFSVADGHSFRKWHKKLALAFVDLARCNAYVTRSLATSPTTRDPHRRFMVELIADLFNGGWRHTLTDAGVLYPDVDDDALAAQRTPVRLHHRTTASPPALQSACIPRHSALMFPKSRPKRGCVICRFEGRHPTEATNYCTRHNVALCSQAYTRTTPATYHCQMTELTCWEKFHQFYLSQGLFNEQGHIRRSSEIYKQSKLSGLELFSPSNLSDASSVFV